MTSKSLSNDLQRYLERRQLVGKFLKQKAFFEANPFHSSLHTELLEHV